jgi:hypothetical protein
MKQMTFQVSAILAEYYFLPGPELCKDHSYKDEQNHSLPSSSL